MCRHVWCKLDSAQCAGTIVFRGIVHALAARIKQRKYIPSAVVASGDINVAVAMAYAAQILDIPEAHCFVPSELMQTETAKKTMKD